MYQEWQRSEYHISTDINQIDISVVHQFLASSCWAKGLPLEVLERSLKNSLIFGLYKENQQIAILIFTNKTIQSEKLYFFGNVKC